MEDLVAPHLFYWLRKRIDCDPRELQRRLDSREVQRRAGHKTRSFVISFGELEEVRKGTYRRQENVVEDGNKFASASLNEIRCR